jgi:hypothetical protein
MFVIMTRALLVIDVQESFRQGPLWPAISNPGIASEPDALGGRLRGGDGNPGAAMIPVPRPGLYVI